MRLLFEFILFLLLALKCQSATSLDHKDFDWEVSNKLRNHITLSGYSAGGSFAQMLQMCYSSLFDGVATFSHSHYRCGPGDGDVDEWDRVCTTIFNASESEYYNTDNVMTDISDYFSKGLIEDPKNLEDKRLYVYVGLANPYFTISQQLNAIKVYENYIKNPLQIFTRVQNSGLLMPTDNFGLACKEDQTNNYLLGNCGLSVAYDAIKFLYHNVFPIANPSSSQRPIQLEFLISFNQTAFFQDIEDPFMDSIGYYYVPRGCIGKYSSCLLHLFFHGCGNGRQFNGAKFIQHSGYLEVAELNNIIMMFPQAVSTADGIDGNGCFDTFGAGGPLYATQQGRQIIVVKRMIDAVLATSTGNLKFMNFNIDVNLTIRNV